MKKLLLVLLFSPLVFGQSTPVLQQGTTNGIALYQSATSVGSGAVDTTTTHALFATAGAPAFRALAAGDIPTAISIANIGSAGLSGTAPIGIASTGAISITGAAGQVLAGASPAFTATPALGTDNSVAGTLQLANSAAAAHTIWSSGATTTNTIAGFAAVPTTGDIVTCTTASTTCTLTDGGATVASLAPLASPTFTGTVTLPAVTNTGIFTNSTAGALSASAFNMTGAPITGGSATTTFPLVYFNDGTAPTTFSTNGTELGMNAPTGFTGNFLDFHVNGGASVFGVSATGAITAVGMNAGSGSITSVNNLSGNGSVAFNSGTVGGKTLQVVGSNSAVVNFTQTQCETAGGPTTLSTGATTTATGQSCLPANSIIDAVVARVTTTITGSCTGWELGDGTTAARFSSNNTTLTSGTTTDAAHIGTFNNTGIASATTGMWQASAGTITVTCAGGNASAGAIRILVFSHTWVAPTS